MLAARLSVGGKTTGFDADEWTCVHWMYQLCGLKGGAVYGASDAHAAYVKDKPVSTADICATVYECLGIDPTMPIRDYAGRPVPVARPPTTAAAPSPKIALAITF